MDSSTNTAWLKGKQVAFVGKLASMSRAEAARVVGECGGHVATEPTLETAYLILGQESELLNSNGQPALPARTAKLLQEKGAKLTVLLEEEFLSKCRIDSLLHEGQQLYTGIQVCRILKIPPVKFRRWLKSGLVEAASTEHGVSFYDFQQVSWAKTLSKLTGAGVTPDRIRQSLRQLKAWLASDDPLTQLRLLEQDGKVMVRLSNGQLADPHGQAYLDFDNHKDDRTIQAQTSARSASDWLSIGIDLEEKEHLEEAAAAYQEALKLGGPEVHACYNLANVLYSLGHKHRAAERYHQVIEIDPGYAPAWNNLGIVLGELELFTQASTVFKRAIEIDPTVPDYYYSLADLLESNGQDLEAKNYWRKYLQYERHGEYADYARSRLAVS